MKEATWDYATFQKKAHLGALDGMRAISILLVIWHHTGGVAWTLPMLVRGFLGVDIFFVISGFLIVTLLLRERDKYGEISLKSFYARRTLRIFPIYYLVLGVLTFILLFIVPQTVMAAPFFAAFPYYVSYTSNWIHDITVLSITWSLATEEQFYLVWPPLEKYLARWAIPILLLVIFFNQLINFQYPPALENFLLAHQLDSLEIMQTTFTPICLGVLMAHILHDSAGYSMAQRSLGNMFVPFVLLGGLVIAFNYPGSDIRGFPRLSIHILVALLLASLVLLRTHPLIRFLSHPWMVRIGVISYGMYIYHLIARHVAKISLLKVNFMNEFSLFILTAVLTILISEASFRWYEAPFLRLKKYFERDRANKSQIS